MATGAASREAPLKQVSPKLEVVDGRVLVTRRGGGTEFWMGGDGDKGTGTNGEGQDAEGSEGGGNTKMGTVEMHLLRWRAGTEMASVLPTAGEKGNQTTRHRAGPKPGQFLHYQRAGPAHTEQQNIASSERCLKKIIP